MFSPLKMSKHGDIETGTQPLLYPSMTENPELRWSFIRKIYTILTIQLLLTVAVSAVLVFVTPIADFVVSSTLGFSFYIVMLVLPLIILCPMYIYRQRHPVNFIFLGVFTVCIAFGIGLSCAFSSGKNSRTPFTVFFLGPQSLVFLLNIIYL
ncbi:hypothetical protein GIB67_040926 [Kingdonia uniflora]|uniref:BI1-like protein n=1 Tax=Kingdonia uniflora TaxID=39325 RepID=A0A7J7PD59_9MAGN|nr:hypothetical protein GIB67_040926 [Kingdonia uniflora]